MSDWYYAKNNQQQGPVTTETLKRMADSGDLQPTDMVWHAGMSSWAPASSAKELFPAGAPVRRPARPAATETRERTRPRRRPQYEDDFDDDFDDDHDDHDDYEDSPRRRRRVPPPPRRKGLSGGAWAAIIGGIVLAVGLIVGIIIWVIVANTPRREGRHLSPPATVHASLDRVDQRFQGKYAEIFTVNMTRNRNYIIEMDSTEFDTYLYLQDPNGRIVRRDDDGGPGLNSRLIYRPRVDGVHRIVATSFGRSFGRFRLRVR